MLPCVMLAPQIPRSEWPSHPRYPMQTLLLGSHDGFRRRSTWIVERLLALDPDDGAQDSRRRRWVTRMKVDFDWWMVSMGRHEHYEETKLYRYLAHRYQTSFDHLEADHVELNQCKDAVLQAFEQVIDNDVKDPDMLAGLIELLQTHQARLFVHLEREEDLIVPLLLTLKPEEFLTYYNSPIDVLLEAQ